MEPRRSSAISGMRKAGFISMRSLPLRCLMVLLSLALVSSNARAELHLGAVHHQPCPEKIGHTYGKVSHHRHNNADHACCCDCLGCVSVINLTPDLSNFLPAFPAAVIRYREEPLFLAGRVLLPQPDPPRPSSPI